MGALNGLNLNTPYQMTFFSGSFEANADCYKLDQKIQLYYNEKDPAKHRTKNWVGDLVVGCLAIIVGVSIIHYDIGN